MPLFSMASNFYPVGADNATTSYKVKSECELLEKANPNYDGCYSITDKDMRKYKIGFIMPAVEDTADCDDAVACQLMLDDDLFACNGETFDDKDNWPGLDFGKDRPKKGWFLWCETKGLVFDQVKADAADAFDVTKATEKALKKSKKDDRKADKDACVAAVNGGGNLTDKKIKDCIELLIKEVFSEDIDPADL